MMAFLPKSGAKIADHEWVTAGLAERMNAAFHQSSSNKCCKYHKLLRNGHQGRIPIRVKDGRILLHGPTAERFESAAIGNPSRIESPDVALTVLQAKQFDALRDRVAQQYDDVAYRLVQENGSLVILATPIVNDMIMPAIRYPVANLTGS